MVEALVGVLKGVVDAANDKVKLKLSVDGSMFSSNPRMSDCGRAYSNEESRSPTGNLCPIANDASAISSAVARRFCI